jgi:superfamily II DNA or RNA helicase
MPVFSHNEIRRLATNQHTFLHGCDVHARHLVQNLTYNPDQHSISAIVAGSHNYQVKIRLNTNESIAGYSCSCPAFFDCDGACEHIVAVLLYFGVQTPSDTTVPPSNQANPPEVFGQPDKEADLLATSRNLIAAFLTQSQSPARRQIKLQVTLYIDPANSALPYLEMQIGDTRLYMVKKLRELLEAIDEERTLYFGKLFTLYPKCHSFHPHDLPLIDLLLELYRDERNVWNYRSDFEKNRLELKPSQLRRFLLFAGEMPQAYWQKNPQEPRRRIVVSQEPPPLEFQVTQGPQYVEVALRQTRPPLFLTSAKDIMVVEDCFYLLSPRTARPLMNFWDTLSRYPDRRLPLADPEAATFLTQVVPLLRQSCRLEIAPDVRERLHNEPLQISLWLDKLGDGIALKPRFLYGATEIDPLSNVIVNLPQDKLLCRDIAGEARLTAAIKEAGFTIENGYWALRREDRIYHFLSEVLPAWAAAYHVYRSEDFNRLRIKQAPRLGGAIRLNELSDLLEITLDQPDLPSEEIAAFWAAVREKKKYYRLKNGEFINLAEPETQSAGKLLSQLSFSEADLQKGRIAVPKYRMLYLEQAVRNYDPKRFGLNATLENLVRTIKNPQLSETPLPTNLTGVLRDYQKAGFKWLKALSSCGFGAILADDMGLGKTLQIIAWVQSEYCHSPLPSLVIAPTSLVYNWREEAAKFAPDLPVLVVDGTKEERQELLRTAKRHALVITSFPLLRRDIEELKPIKFNCCILDEAQNIKNPATINAKTVKQIHARHHFAVTGTPIENSLTELWSIFDFIMPGYLYSHHKFQARFETPVVRHNDAEALTDLGRHIKPFILRRLKKDVLAELPEKIETKVSCDMTVEQKKAYLAYLAHARQEFKTELDTRGFPKSQIKVLALITRLRQICCHPALFLENFQGDSGKLELLLELVRDSRSAGHRLLIFSQFVTMLDLIAAKLQAEQIPYSRIDGQTPPRERLDLVNAFNAGMTETFLISLKAGGTGLNLTGADTVIHYDPWWNPAVEDQATDRAHRIGQQHVVQVFKLVTKGTIEDKIYALQQKKKALIDSVIQPGENFLGKMTVDEIKGLFAE